MDFYWTCKLEIKHEALSVQFNETTYWLLNGLFFHLPRRCAVHPLDSDLPSFTAVVLTFTLSYIIYLADKRKRKRKGGRRLGPTVSHRHLQFTFPLSQSSLVTMNESGEKHFCLFLTAATPGGRSPVRAPGGIDGAAHV